MTVTISLTDAQLAQVMRETTSVGSLTRLLGDADDAHRLRQVVAPLYDDPRYSRSTLRALTVLGAFTKDGIERDLKHVAEEVELSPSTTHRYISTWVMLGLLEQDPASRRYRRAPAREAARV